MRNVVEDARAGRRVKQLKRILQQQLFEPDEVLSYFLDQYAAARNSGLDMEPDEAYEKATELTFRKFGWELRRPEDGEGLSTTTQ